MSRFLTLLIGLVLCGCGGGGGGGSSPGGPGAVAIQFPPPSVMTDASAINVRGVTTGDDIVTGVTVNGIAASSADSFLNWSVIVPLIAGPNVLSVSTTLAGGGGATDATSVTVIQDAAATTTANQGTGPVIDDPQDVLLDRANNRLIVTDSGGISTPGAVYTVDLATGNRSVLSDGATGGGTPATLGSPHGLGADFSTNSIYITDRTLDLIIRVDSVTGARTVVSDGSVGAAPTFENPIDVEFLPPTNELAWIDSPVGGDPRVLRASTAAGNTRSVVTDSMNPGPVLAALDMLRFFPNDGVLLATADDLTGILMSINLTTGERTELASGTTGIGAGGTFGGPTGIGLDASFRGIITHLRNDGRTITVDLNSGNRNWVSEENVVGTGPAVSGPQSTEYDDQKRLVYVVDTTLDAVFVIDHGSGDRAILSK